jgi:phage terminase large subunit
VSRVQRIDLGYTARNAFIPFHMRRQRWGCVVAHRRAGKTVACVMDLIDAALRCEKPNGRFAYIAPFYAQAKDVAWTYVKQFGGLIPGAQPNESELRLDFPNGARVRLYGADNYDRMRGIYLDGVILDEYGDMDPRVWPEVIRPALSDRKGSATFIGTPKGRNNFLEIHQHAEASPDWFSMVLKAGESGLVADEELADARAMMTPEQYAQEFECSFDAAIQGAYYASLLADAEAQGRVLDFDADPALPIYTAWDLGIGDSTAIWVFQAAPDGMRLVDHIEDHGKPLPHYVAELNARGYRVKADYVPHDARVRELGTGRTRLETLAGMGRNPQLLPIHQVDDGINAVRQLFPRMWIASRCRDGIEALRQYRTDFDEKAKVFKKTPRHDWTSHTADALRYAAMGYRDLVLTRIAEKAKPAPGQVWIGPPPTSGEKRSRI